MKILAINDGHNASVALYVDGVITFSLSEERVSRIKNFYGFPSLAIKKAIEYGKFESVNDIDVFIIYRSSVIDFLYWRFLDKKFITEKIVIKIINLAYNLFPVLVHFIDKYVSNKIIKKYYAKELKTEASKITLVNHHEAHAHSSLINLDKSKNHLIFTLDAEGDL